MRFRNKRGAKNTSYKMGDYDILAGVWVEASRIYLFRLPDLIKSGMGEAITVATYSGRPLSAHARNYPYFSGTI